MIDRPLVGIAAALVACLVLLVGGPTAAQPAAPTIPNLALHLDGYGDYVELPAGILDELTAGTIEAWVRWDAFAYYAQWFHYGTAAAGRALGINTFGESPRLQLFLYDGLAGGALRLAAVATDLPLRRWHHVAAVTGPAGMRLYLNGVAIAESATTGSFANAAGGSFWLGRSDWVDNAYFAGWLDAVRVWSTARSAAQIRASMHAPAVTGPDLVAAWSFDDGDVCDVSGNGHDGVLHGDARIRPAALPAGDQVLPTVVIEGHAEGPDGGLPVGGEAEVWVDGGTRVVAGIANDGRFRVVRVGEQPYQLRVTAGDLGTWLSGPRPADGVARLDLLLPPASRIAGTVRTLDNKPLADVIVEALRVDANGGLHPAGTRSANRQGRYAFDNLRPGSYRVRCHLRGGYATHGAGRGGSDIQLAAGARRDGVDFHVEPLLRGIWRSFDAVDGYTGGAALRILQHSDGSIWIGTNLNGLWRFDGEGFHQWTTADGLAHDTVRGLFEDDDGSVWLATDAGLSHIDGGRFLPVNCAPLAGKRTLDVLGDDRGELWIATHGQGLWRYDGACEQQLTSADGLAGDRVQRLLQAGGDTLWVGTSLGVSVLVGGDLVPFDNTALPSRLIHDLHRARDGAVWLATERGATRCRGGDCDSLPRSVINRAFTVAEDRRGHLWIATPTALIRHDGHTYTRITEADDRGLAYLRDIVETADGALWIARDSGLSVHDPETVVTFSGAHGLRGSRVLAVRPEGPLQFWVGTDAGGQRFDGQRFLDDQPGGAPLPSVAVRDFERDADGVLWAATDLGAWRRTATSWESVAVSEVATVITDIHLGRGDTLWFATDSGVAYRTAGRFHTTSLPTIQTFESLLSDSRAGLWVGGNDFGLYRLLGDHVDHWQTPSTLRTISALVVDDNDDIWAGTIGGIIRLRPGAGAALPIEQMARTIHTSRDGLDLSGVDDLAYRDGRLYGATSAGGVVIHDGVAWTAVDDDDGLPTNRTNALAFDATGDLWIGMQGGLARYRPRRDRPRAHIAAIRTDTLLAPRDGVDVAVGTRATIEYGVVDLHTSARKRQFRHRLRADAAATDSGWSAPTRVGRFEWTPRQPGRWLFEVQAIDRDLNYSAPAAVVLRVFLPWHANGWITVPGAMVVALLVVGSSWRAVRHRLESARLRQQMLAQEHEARVRLQAQNEELEQARREAESANAAKSAFLANMSHEIRTPMNAVLGFTRMLRRADDLGPAARDKLDTIARNGGHLLALINDVLDLSKIEAGRVEREDVDFDLVVLVGDLAATFAPACQERDLTWATDWTPGEPARARVRGDEGKLRQVLLNLAGNAVKFTDSGGVRLAVEARGHDRWRFAVTDTGPGIDDATQQRIFEPFEQGASGSRVGGTGLGLAIARRFVALMGGDLELESPPGRGATFRFEILLAGVADTGPAPATAVGARFRGVVPTALVVDDVAENRAILEDLLTTLGCRVHGRAGGRQALRRLTESGPLAAVDVVFMDIWMPDLDGTAVARQLRADLGDACPRLVAVSASVLPHERQGFLDAGFDAFLPKPVREQDVLACLGDLPGVELDAATPVAPSDLGTAALPAELLEELRRAASRGDLTTLKQALPRLSAVDGAGPLIDELSRLVRDVDVKGLRTTLSRIAPDDA